MSELLNRFEIFSKIGEEIKQKIKIFHVFNDKNGQNLLFITSDDKVYGFGSNYSGCCGLGHNSVVNEPQIIPELCHKNIQQFFIGGSFILGLNNDNKVYAWGRNYYGQLGRGYNEIYLGFKNYYKPRKIKISSESVIQLSCGYRHCLALTADGKVYGWGSNKFGQIGCGKEKGKKISTPLHLDIFPQFSVKSIHCSINQSYALTTDGLVYSWGWNHGCSLGYEFDENKCVFEPKQILNIPKITIVCPARSNIYFLTNENEIYFCGHFKDKNNNVSIQKLPELLYTKLKVEKLHVAYDSYKLVPSAVSGTRIFELFGKKGKETNYNSFFEFYSMKHQMSYKTIHINSDQNFDGNDLKDIQNYKVFDKYFINCDNLGSGGFGTVYKVRDKLHQQHFAVKKIPFSGKN